ncbi:GTP-binding protein Obg/CgtA [Amylocystis lapponica]|nr:GTP-binding protein Obg/CgtA [Amylocystis lapponica]
MNVPLRTLLRAPRPRRPLPSFVVLTGRPAAVHTATSEPVESEPVQDDSEETLRRKRRTDWKRRQGGQTFLDHVIVHVRAGKGGDGCVAFHREKFKPYGPPSGGNGGRGGDVYIMATPHLTTLSSVPVRIRGHHGGNGQGTWQNGKNGTPLIIKVPLGTIDEYEAEAETLEGLAPDERRQKLRERRWRAAHPIFLDLDRPDEVQEAADPNAPLGTRRHEPAGHRVAAGGGIGLGNPHFLSGINRSPNTLLRALSGGRAKTEVAGYAFTTLNPVVAVVRVSDDGRFEGSVEGAVYDETRVEEQRARALMESGTLAAATTRNQRLHGDVDVDGSDALESFRFTVADNPGLIERASSNVGLGHSFLRSIERSHALVYVVDLSSPAPWDDLRVLRDEIEKYKPGISPKGRMVLANKADLLGGADGEEDAEAVREAQAKLRRLEEFVEREMTVEEPDRGVRRLDVVPISAKYSMNLQKVVSLMRGYVEEARGPSAASCGREGSSDLCR